MKMKKLLKLTILASLLVLTALAFGPGSSQATEKIGVIMHDHGAPRTFNSVSYYGMKWFLNAMVDMNVIPSFLRDGFPFDPFHDKWGVMLIDKNHPYEEVPWLDLQLMDAWGNDQTWLKYVDMDPNTPGIQPPYTWTPAGTDMYGNVGHYLLFKYPYSFMFPSLLGWNEPDFFEFVGLDFYNSWKKKGGVEVYYDQVVEQRNAVRDAIWEKYKQVLTGMASPMDSDKEMYIRLTNGIDGEFPNSDPAASRHAQSLYDAIKMLVMDHGVTKLVIDEYFLGFSQMMNDEMDRMTVMDALMDLEMMGYTDIKVIYAPDKIPIGEVTVPVYSCSQWPPAATQTGTETKTTYVGGIALSNTFQKAVEDQAVIEFNKIPASAGNIAMFLSNHGTPTKLSFCFDSANDYLHNTYKALFVRLAKKISNDLGAKKLVYGPDTISDTDLTNLYTVATLSKNIQYATATLKDGRKLKFFRTAGQSANSKDDPSGLAYSPREAIAEIVANTDGANYKRVIDLLYNFFGDSGDLLIDHRLDGYGNDNEADPLYLLAWQYCNPNVPAGDIHDCSNPQYAGLQPYESEFDWSGIHVRITNATWGFDAKEKAATQYISAGIEQAAGM
jgi:hypothetical protein